MFVDYVVRAMRCPSWDFVRLTDDWRCALTRTSGALTVRILSSSTFFLTVTSEYNRIPLYWKETSVTELNVRGKSYVVEE